MPPEGYPFPYVYPPMGYVPAPPDGQQHAEGANGATPAMPHPFYPPYPALYPHPYGYPGAPPMPYPPLIPAPVAASPNGTAKPDSASAPPSANGAASASVDPGTNKGKKRTKAKNGEEGGRASKKAKDASQGDVQQQYPNGDAEVAKEHPPPGPQQQQPPPPPPYAGHVEPAAGPGPVPAFGGPEPRPLMATM